MALPFSIANQVPIFDTTQRQLNELVAIANARGDQVNTPTAIVATLINRELRKESKNETT